MVTKLGIFNGALRELGQRRLTDTGDLETSAYELVDIWDQVVEECLSVGSWNFAMETIKADADTGVVPEFGYTEVFAKPSDWVRTHAISEDEYFNYPMLHYDDDANFWTCNSTPIYARYVSNDTGLGLDLNKWPVKFARYVELELADRVCIRLVASASEKERIAKDRDTARRTALNHDAMNERNPKYSAPGSWTQSRTGGGIRGDRGSRNRLTG